MPSIPSATRFGGSARSRSTKVRVLREPSSPSSRGEETENPSPIQHRDLDGSTTAIDLDELSDASVESSDEYTIEQAQKFIKYHYQSRSIPHYPTFSFQGERSYQQLSRNLQDSGLLRYFEDELRADWNAMTGMLMLRISPTTLHEVVLVSLVMAIEKELDNLVKAHKSLRTARKKILQLGHSDMTNETKEDAASIRKSPDAQFCYSGTRASPFVLEVAYSEGERKAAVTCKDYLKFLGAEAVLSIDIEYAATEMRRDPNYEHRATFRLWTVETTDFGKAIRPKTAVFREMGQSSQEHLAIPFKLFLPSEARTGTPDEGRELRFSYELLAQIVREAEQQQRVSDELPSPPLERRTRWIEYDDNGNVVADEMVELVPK